MEPRAQPGGETSIWLRLDTPFVWLAYLPLYFIPWLFVRPDAIQIAGSAVGLALFLALYLRGSGTTGRPLIAYAISVLVLSIALIPAMGNWTVLSIYAAAMIGELRPARHAGLLVGSFAAVTAGAGLFSGQPFLYWGFGVFLMVMVGSANISRAALQDKNAELSRAQDAVRHMAATAERERIARDVHDLIGRSLTLIAIKADLAARLAPKDAGRAEGEMHAIAATAREALVELREAIAGMTGATLAREISSARTALSAAGISCTVDADAAGLDPGRGAVLAMTLREAVTNVIRHSGARHCWITLAEGPDGLELTVRDDGDGTAVREAGGLAGVRSRLAAGGGALTIAGDALGTRVVARLPQGAAA